MYPHKDLLELVQCPTCREKPKRTQSKSNGTRRADHDDSDVGPEMKEDVLIGVSSERGASEVGLLKNGIALLISLSPSPSVRPASP